jgi:ParB-like chromosome segregation protein Spo0J
MLCLRVPRLGFGQTEECPSYAHHLDGCRVAAFPCRRLDPRRPRRVADLTKLPGPRRRLLAGTRHASRPRPVQPQHGPARPAGGARAGLGHLGRATSARRLAVAEIKQRLSLRDTRETARTPRTPVPTHRPSFRCRRGEKENPKSIRPVTGGRLAAERGGAASCASGAGCDQRRTSAGDQRKIADERDCGIRVE